MQAWRTMKARFRTQHNIACAPIEFCTDRDIGPTEFRNDRLSSRESSLLVEIGVF